AWADGDAPVAEEAPAAAPIPRTERAPAVAAGAAAPAAGVADRVHHAAVAPDGLVVLEFDVGQGHDGGRRRAVNQQAPTQAGAAAAARLSVAALAAVGQAVGDGQVGDAHGALEDEERAELVVAADGQVVLARAHDGQAAGAGREDGRQHGLQLDSAAD